MSSWNVRFWWRLFCINNLEVFLNYYKRAIWKMFLRDLWCRIVNNVIPQSLRETSLVSINVTRISLKKENTENPLCYNSWVFNVSFIIWMLDGHCSQPITGWENFIAICAKCEFGLFNWIAPFKSTNEILTSNWWKAFWQSWVMFHTF